MLPMVWIPLIADPKDNSRHLRSLSDIFNAGFDQFDYKYYTWVWCSLWCYKTHNGDRVQRYPNNACSGVTPHNTNLTYYLTHANGDASLSLIIDAHILKSDVVGEFLGWQKKGMDAATQRNVPVLMTEYNSVSCGGSNISSTVGFFFPTSKV